MFPFVHWSLLFLVALEGKSADGFEMGVVHVNAVGWVRDSQYVLEQAQLLKHRKDVAAKAKGGP